MDQRNQVQWKTSEFLTKGINQDQVFNPFILIMPVIKDAITFLNFTQPI